MGDMGTVIPAGFLVAKQIKEDHKVTPFSVVVHAGDISYAGTGAHDEISEVWDLWGAQVEPISSIVPYMTNVGNHEAYYNFTVYRNRFRMPGPESGGLDNFWFSFNTGPIHWVSMSSQQNNSSETNMSLMNIETSPNTTTLINTEKPTTSVTLMNTKISMASSLATKYMSMGVRDRRHRDETEAERTFRNIIKDCHKNKTNFVDNQFPHSSSSLGDRFSHDVFQWFRIADIRSSSKDDDQLEWTVMSSPKPSDIEQGLLGNCWLIAALSLIVERPGILRHILLTQNVNSEGIYLVRLCHNGLWTTIIVDDFFPCYEDGTLLFTKARRRQLFIPIIEKACAKLFGSYSNLTSGQMAEALQLFTGAPCDYIHLDRSDEPIDSDIVWAKLVSCCQANLLIGASTGRHDVSKDMYDQIRINSNHAFSILATHATDKDSVRFVLVRDPHACSCYRDEYITPKVLTQLRTINNAHRSTGAFWIEWTKFLRFFSKLTISTYVNNYFDIREQAKFTRLPTDPITVFYFHVPHQRELCTYWSGSLRPGIYYIIPFSTSFWHRHEQTEELNGFTLVIHSSVQIEGLLGNEKTTFLADSLIAYVMKSCEKPQEFDNTTFYTTPKNQKLTIMVIENLSTTYHLNVDVDMSESRNIRHSRNSFVTHDCIPPQHRQIICITEWIMQPGQSGRQSFKYSRQLVKNQSESIPPVRDTTDDIHTLRPI
ncbi:unnamed protein product [Rotaria sp. Silwood1]|nr:unnamed protein product [Rotaria sp. Silwood1]